MRTPLVTFGLVAALAVLAAVLVIGAERDAAPAGAAQAPVVGAGGMPEMGVGQPDLVVTSIVSNQNGPFPCQTPAGVLVTVRNQGTAAAPASFGGVSVGSLVEVVEFPALAVSQEATAFAPVIGIPSGDTYTGHIDPLNVIAESNESNNTLVVNGLVVGSLPTCTPTPTITATFTATPTATPTGFSGQDTDGDGILGSVDNCPFVFNPGQENSTDGNYIDHSPPYNPASMTRRTHCPTASAMCATRTGTTTDLRTTSNLSLRARRPRLAPARPPDHAVHHPARPAPRARTTSCATPTATARSTAWSAR